jgi:hypothetical protein
MNDIHSALCTSLDREQNENKMIYNTYLINGFAAGLWFLSAHTQAQSRGTARFMVDEVALV